MGCGYSLPDNLRDEIIEARHAQKRDTERFQTVIIKEPDKVNTTKPITENLTL